MPKQISQNGIALIKKFEGFRATAYKDVVGIWTIGHGHVIKDNEQYLLTATLSEAEATELLLQDLEYFVNTINNTCQEFHIDLTQNQFDALCSFTFNTGCFNQAMKDRFQHKDIAGIGKALTLYDKAGSNVVEGLLERRKAEQELFFSKD